MHILASKCFVDNLGVLAWVRRICEVQHESHICMHALDRYDMDIACVHALEC